MSVIVLNHHDALKLLEKDYVPAQPETRNFFEVFGTTGCLMKCEKEKNLEPKFQYDKTQKSEPAKMKRKDASLALRAYLRGSHGLLHSWFKTSEITASASQGCGSCSVFREMLEKSFPGNEFGLSDKYEYLVSRTFELRRQRPRLPGEEVVPDEVVQLFQPRHSRVKLMGFKASNFLCGRDVSLDRVRQWMDNCSSSHEQCTSNRDTQRHSINPARLLDVIPNERGNKVGVRIIETSAFHSYRYICLSHRWDDAIEQHQSTTENISDSLDFLDIGTMPANFRDVILIARELNIQYVWIDSLCIIQKGDHGQDLRRELSKMGSIYQHAYLTIAAVSSPGSSGGCFIKDTWPDICFQAKKGRTVPKPRAKESTAPSWSWASLSMGQVLRHVDASLVGKGGGHQTEVWLTSNALLRNTIKEVQRIPESAMNPFGRLKSASLKLNTTLYKWYLHLSCTMARPNVKTNTNKRRGRYHFYIETRYSLMCATEPEILVVDGADIDIRLDSDMQDEGVTMQTFSDCVGNPLHPCRLVEVHLLHALHKENELRGFDVFLLLNRVPTDNGGANCYRRIGLMMVSLEEGKRDSWSEVMHAKMEPRMEVFWMY